MSRIGKKAVEVPSGVKVAISGRSVTIEGPKGTLSYEHRPEVQVALSDDGKSVEVAAPSGKEQDRVTKAHWGTTRALINNMVKGVKDGYEKKLEVIGVGWTASLAGQKLQLKVGYANTIELAVPQGVTVSVDKQVITVAGADKQAVGEFAASVRAKRKPEPYNGKGIKYVDEVIKRKQGKAFGS